MQKILVPTDFSDTAGNAARYAVEFAKQFLIPKIILFNAYQAPLSVDPTTPVLQLFNLDDIKQASIEGLTLLKDKLSPDAGDVQLEILNEFATISDSINETAEKTEADIIIMGITGGSGLDALVGSNTITVADSAKVPVIIVPATCTYKPVKNMVWVFDAKNKLTEIALLPVKKILDEMHAKINVLSIDQHHNPENVPGKLYIDLLQNYSPEFHYVYNKNFADAANEFAESSRADMIITISKKHGFFENIFRKNHTKQLAFHTHLPLICVHEKS